jgi:phage tail sheath protein FI
LAGLEESYKTALTAQNDMLYFGSVAEAKEALKDTAGSIAGAIDGVDDQGVNAPIVISLVGITDAESKKEAEKFYSNTAIKTKIITAVGNLKKVSSLFGQKPDVIASPRFSHDGDVLAELTAVATALNGVAVVDLNAKDEAEALTKVKAISSKNVLVTDPYVKVWDTANNKATTEPMSARVAGMIARTDGEREYGFADSASNRVVYGISGTARAVEYVAGADCEADRLRGAGISTIINYNGYRLWGYETTDVDPVWKALERVRTFAKIGEAVQEATFWAIDKRADVLNHVRASVEGFANSLKGANVLIGYDVFWHPEKNTKENITAGKFYLVAELQNMPTVRRLEIECVYVDKFSPVLMKIIGGNK